MEGIRTADAAWFVGSFGLFCLWFFAGKVWIDSPGYAAAIGEGVGTGGEPAAQQLAHKRLRSTSWLVGLLTSLIMTIFSVYSTTQFVSHVVVSWASAAHWLESDDPIGRAVTCFFVASLFADIGLGLVYYPAQIDVLQGWIHHSGYLWLIVWLMGMGWTNSFIAYAICESPTLILAAGSVFPPWRMNLPMGVAFFSTRIAYYTWVYAVVACYAEGYVRASVGAAVLCLHAYWFVGWVRSYRRTLHASAAGKRRVAGAKRNKSSDSEPKGDAAGGGVHPAPSASPPVSATSGGSSGSGQGGAILRGSSGGSLSRAALGASGSDCDDASRLLGDPAEQVPQRADIGAK